MLAAEVTSRHIVVTLNEKCVCKACGGIARIDISVQPCHLVEKMKTTCKYKSKNSDGTNMFIKYKTLICITEKYKVFGRLTESQCSCTYL